MLVIDPDVCIDCGICVSECPVGAILPDTDTAALPWLNLNSEYSKIWPNIILEKEPLPDAQNWANVPNKYPQFFDPNGPSHD